MNVILSHIFKISPFQIILKMFLLLSSNLLPNISPIGNKLLMILLPCINIFDIFREQNLFGMKLKCMLHFKNFYLLIMTKCNKVFGTEQNYLTIAKTIGKKGYIIKRPPKKWHMLFKKSLAILKLYDNINLEVFEVKKYMCQ